MHSSRSLSHDRLEDSICCAKVTFCTRKGAERLHDQNSAGEIAIRGHWLGSGYQKECNPNLRETIIFWSQLARVYAEDLGPDHLGGMLQGLFAKLDLKEEDVEFDLSEEQQSVMDQAILLFNKKLKI
ncbi:hypothetical protein DL765_011436 [Monosporascus sp. GIB2]|nr:hypothetical protein DL765_011436 [Monosporascus sp. GIB2]